MKRLFCVKKNGNKVKLSYDWVLDKMHHKSVNTDLLHTNSKAVAKEWRDQLGGANAGFTVSRGPDHIGKHSGYKVPMMRRQPKKVGE